MTAATIPKPRRTGRPLALLLLATSPTAILLVCWALWRGQDVNWDWQNYHLYDALALLHDRWHADVAPGGPQSFLNPLPYLIPYLSRRLLPPIPACLIVTISQLAPLLVAAAIAWRIHGDRPGRFAVAMAAAFCAGTGAVMLSEAGTSFCDVILAAPPLLGLLLLLPRPGSPHTISRLLAAGWLVGIAVGAKPTGLFLLPAMAAGALLAVPAGATLAARLRILAATAAGSILGALTSDGPWALALWHDYASPVFPYVNGVFRSRSAEPVDFSDPRYHWQGLAHALSLPFALAKGSDATGEVIIRDPRLLLGSCASIVLLLSALRPRSAGRYHDPLHVLAAWFLVGYAFWALLNPIQRYAVFLDILASLIVVLSVARLAKRRRTVALPAIAALLVLTTRPGDYFHRPWSTPYVAHVPSAVSPGATYGLLDQPLGYWVAATPRPSHAFTLLPALLPDGGTLETRLHRILADPAANLWLLSLDLPLDPTARQQMSRHGLVRAAPCVRAPSMVWIDTVFCRGVRAPPRADAASDLSPDQRILFSRSGIGLIYELDGWDATEAAGIWARGNHDTLSFHPSRPFVQPMVLSITTNGIDGVALRHVTAEAGGGPSQLWPIRQKDPVTHRLCIGPAREPGDVVHVDTATDDVRSLSALGLGVETRHLAFRLFDMELVAARPGECG